MPSAALPIPDDDAYVEYASVTGTGPLAVPFPLPPNYAGALHVSVNNVELAGSAFAFTPDSATLSGYPTGTVTLAAATAAANVKIWRDTPMTRTSDYAQGPFDVGAFNAEVTRLLMQIQDNRLRVERSETTGSLQSRTVTPTGATKSRTLADHFQDIINVEDFTGADPSGATDSYAAINAALNSGVKHVLMRGTFLTSQTIVVPKGVALDASGSIIKPSANVDVLRLHGGGMVVGRPIIDVTAQVGWSAAAVLFDGASEASAATLFRMYEPTICQAAVRGKTTGTGNGNGAFFKTFDNGVANQWLMGVWLDIIGQGFDKALYMLKDGADIARTFVNANMINMAWGAPYQLLVMESGHVANYGVDYNFIKGWGQSRGSSEQNAVAMVVEGQGNKIELTPFDWVGGGGGTTKGLTISAGSRNNDIRTNVIASLVDNQSTEKTNWLRNPLANAYGEVYGPAGLPGVKVAAPATRSASGDPGEFAADSSFAYFCDSANSWKWLPAVNWQVLARSFAAVSVTGTTTETTLATIAVPANAMGPNGVLRVTTYWSHTNNANTKTLRTKFGGATLVSPAPTASSTSRHLIEVANRNATNSQIVPPNALATSSAFGASGTAFSTFAIDTTAAQNITLTGQLANAADTITLEGYLVELSYGA